MVTRFLYNRNYVNRDSQEIASHFGRSFEQQLFALNPLAGSAEVTQVAGSIASQIMVGIW